MDGQFRKLGITTLSRPHRNFRIIASAHLPAFGIYWYRRENYLKRKAEFIKTGDKKYITRDIPSRSQILIARCEESWPSG